MTPAAGDRPPDPIRHPVCPLCGRAIPPHAKQSVHHLIPKLKGGAKGPTARLHEICHRTIHKTFTAAELARTYNRIEALRGHPAMARFIEWVAKKDPAFHAPTRGARRRQGRSLSASR